jgi:hypothetical protein
LRFKVCTLIAVVFLSFAVIVGFGLLHGKAWGSFFCCILRRNGDGIGLLYRSNYWLFLRARLRRFRRFSRSRYGYTADIPTSSAR